jgi:hypothetical protein
MATVAAVAGVVSAVAGVAGAVSSSRASKKAEKEQRKQNAIRNRQAQLNNQREIRRSIAQGRVQVAQLEQSGINQGAQGSSIVSGASGAVWTDTATAVGNAKMNMGANAGVAMSSMRQSGYMADVQSNAFHTIKAGASVFGDAETNLALENFFKG